MIRYINTDDDDVVELLEILPCGKKVKLKSKKDGTYTYSYYWFEKEYRPCVVSETFEASPLSIIKLLMEELTDNELASLKRKCEYKLERHDSNYI